MIHEYLALQESCLENRYALRLRSLAIVLVSLAVLGSCAAPGAPPTVTRSQAGVDYINFCTNVSPTARPPREFTTTSYLTTWGSAYSEGAIAGAREALSEDPGIGRKILEGMVPPQRVGAATLIPRRTPLDPFCMLIDAPQSDVVSATSAVLSSLRKYGYSAKQLSWNPTVYETEFVSNSHRAAKWLDRYIAIVEPWSENRSAVLVQRDVFISRQESPYIQAVSVGGNETWILAQINIQSTGK